MKEYTTNQPIGSTKSNEPILGGNPVCPDCLPSVTHLMSCAKLYGNLCSCGADHKTPITDEPPKRNLEQQLCAVLISHTGEHGQNEGAVECLERIIRERDLLLKKAIEVMLKPAHFQPLNP